MRIAKKTDFFHDNGYTGTKFPELRPKLIAGPMDRFLSGAPRQKKPRLENNNIEGDSVSDEDEPGEDDPDKDDSDEYDSDKHDMQVYILKKKMGDGTIIACVGYLRK